MCPDCADVTVDVYEGLPDRPGMGHCRGCGAVWDWDELTIDGPHWFDWNRHKHK